MDVKSREKILLAAGVFYPDVGGPAIHVRKIAERLTEEGFDIRVVAYGGDPSHTLFGFKVIRVSRALPKPLQWLVYTFLIAWHGIGSKLIYAFDPTAAGLPGCVVAKLFRKPFIIRVGGDPIWEREAEMGGRLLPMDDYYKQGLYLEDKPALFKLIKWVLRGAQKMVVYNQNFKDFYHKYFDVILDKIEVIKNPVFKREESSTKLSSKPTILFAGRLVSYKNLPRVIKAFANLSIGTLQLVGSGPEKDNLINLAKSLGIYDRVKFLDSLPQEKLFELIKDSAVCIAPALSEFNPNFILEALSFGKPVLISRGHGLSVDLPKELEFNPMDVEDIENKLSFVLNNANYSNIVSKVASLDLNRTWDTVKDAHVSIIRKLI